MSVHLVAADARRIPLADDSVQCVVTSPPYWGLRKYAGDQELVWDASDNCSHEWGESISVNRTNHTGTARWNHTRNGRDEVQPPEKRVAWLRTQIVQGSFCQLCGAWRGAYGLEPTIEMYVAHTVEILREVRRVLRPDGVVFLNLGDSYAANRGNTAEKPGPDGKNRTVTPPTGKRVFSGKRPTQSRNGAPACGTDGREFLGWRESGCVCSCHDDERQDASSHRNADTSQPHEQDVSQPSQTGRASEHSGSVSASQGDVAPCAQESNKRASSQSSRANHAVGFCSDCLSCHGSASGTSYHVPKPKDLCLIPERVALAAQGDGWWVRSRILWCKPNPMPESVTDRPTDAAEHIWMFTKSERYYYDSQAVAEPLTRPDEADRKTPARFGGADKFEETKHQSRYHSGNEYRGTPTGTRNLRNVWTFATQPYSGAHFATFPEEIPRRCIMAATRPGDLVLDPFGGSGTTGRVAVSLQRRAVLLDLAYTGAYRPLAEARTRNVQIEAFP
jgi:DNA modification methylase